MFARINIVRAFRQYNYKDLLISCIFHVQTSSVKSEIFVRQAICKMCVSQGIYCLQTHRIIFVLWGCPCPYDSCFTSLRRLSLCNRGNKSLTDQRNFLNEQKLSNIPIPKKWVQRWRGYELYRSSSPPFASV